MQSTAAKPDDPELLVAHVGLLRATDKLLSDVEQLRLARERFDALLKRRERKPDEAVNRAS